jgi:hypothetical protein
MGGRPFLRLNFGRFIVPGNIPLLAEEGWLRDQ